MTQVMAVRPVEPTAEQGLRLQPTAAPRWQLNLFVGIAATVVIGYLTFVAAFGVSVVFWDDWAWAGFASHPWHVSFADLWVQHTENIVFFPNLVAAVLIPLTHWNSRAFMGLSAAMLIGVLAITITVFWDEIKKRPLRWLPLPFIVLGLAQYQNTLWAYQIAWFMVLLTLFGAIAVLSRTHLTVTHLVCAAVLGVISSYSSFQGLLVWPVGFVVLLSSGHTKRQRIAWCATGAVVTLGFLADYSWTQTGSAGLGYILSHITLVVRGLLITTGSVIPTMVSGSRAISSPVITEFVGIVLLTSAALVIAAWIRRGRPAGAPAFCVALIITSILFELTLIPSRLVLDPSTGATSRYDTFVWPMLLGTYAYVAIYAEQAVAARSTAENRLVVPLQRVLTFIVVLAIVVGTIVGLQQGRSTRSVRDTAADVLANVQKAPVAVAAPYLYPPCASQQQWCTWLREQTHAIQIQRMSIFHDPSEITRLHTLNVVPDGVAHPLLPIPPTLRTQVDSSSTARAAWDALSAASWSHARATQYRPDSPRSVSLVLERALASISSVDPQRVVDDEWSAPVSVDFFLVQYKPFYQSWLDHLQH